jgi:energy-coupling factor transport system ATP-binding protein
LSLAPLRNRSLSSLSGGQAQRVAIGSVLTAHPKILVLDEPTSALDPASAEEVLAVLQRLVHDNNLTVLLAEHRLERVVQYADSVIWVPSDGGPPLHASPADIMAVAPVYPPVVRLGRSQGWSPLPLSVRDARRLAGELRDRLPAQPAHSRPPASAPKPLATVTGLDVSYGRRLALDGVDLTLHAGEIVALMGRNGAGKSTLFATLSGSIRPAAGQVRLLGPNTDATGVAPHQLRPRALIDLIALVPQQPGDLLYGDDVADECRIADRDSSVPPGTCAELLAGIAGDLDLGRHPRDLSEGERLALALAVVLTARPALIALDEPTRGLDYVAKARLVAILRRLAGDGQGIVLATHDTELAAEVADRVVVLADGAVVTDGPVREVLTQSPVFAPQIAKVLSPLPYLTVSDVTIGLVLNR